MAPRGLGGRGGRISLSLDSDLEVLKLYIQLFDVIRNQTRPVLKDSVDRGLMDPMGEDHIDLQIQLYRDLTEQGAGSNICWCSGPS